MYPEHLLRFVHIYCDEILRSYCARVEREDNPAVADQVTSRKDLKCVILSDIETSGCSATYRNA